MFYFKLASSVYICDKVENSPPNCPNYLYQHKLLGFYSHYFVDFSTIKIVIFFTFNKTITSFVPSHKFIANQLAARIQSYQRQCAEKVI